MALLAVANHATEQRQGAEAEFAPPSSRKRARAGPQYAHEDSAEQFAGKSTFLQNLLWLFFQLCL